MADGTLLCGVIASFNEVPRAMITGLSNIGMTRKTVENIHNDVTNGVADVLASCIRINKPIRISAVCNTNSSTWLTEMALANNINTPFTISWPPEQGFTTGGTISWARAFLTDYTCGSPDIEGRINCEFTITPSGLPTITAGSD